jgi:cysteine-rich secretory family protein/putative peptidoglycan binding protein
VSRRHVSRKPAALFRRFAVGCVATGVVATGAIAASAAPAYASADSARSVFLHSINSARAAHGLHALHVRSDLTSVAQHQAQRMADRRTLFHNPNLTSDIRHWLAIGENVGEGGRAKAIARAFLNSPEHRSNILGHYSDVGVGTVIAHGKVWVVEDFRKPTARFGAAERGTATTSSTAPAKSTDTSTRTTTRTASSLPTLRYGDRGRLVAWVQGRLHVRQDGIFGPITRAAVIRFKRNHGLRPDGIVGHRMWRALGR